MLNGAMLSTIERTYNLPT